VIGDANVQLALQSHLTMLRVLTMQIKILEKSILSQVEYNPSFDFLKSAPGIGDILAETILLETGEIERFKGLGNYASHCRCVDDNNII